MIFSICAAGRRHPASPAVPIAVGRRVTTASQATESDAAGVEVMGAAGFEAEDVIASLLPKITGTVEIVTGDRDLLQLVRDAGPTVRVLFTVKGVTDLATFDEAGVSDRS